MKSVSVMRAIAARQFENYWPGKCDLICKWAPKLDNEEVSISVPPIVEFIQLPEWGQQLGVGGRLMVPSEAAHGAKEYSSVDWLFAMYWFTNGLAERAYEFRNGPIHSYCFRLSGFPTAMWDYAWANRIALFLRRMVSFQMSRAEVDLFGAQPSHKITVTHDVDAVRKTTAIRIKQGLFQVLNSVRSLKRGRLSIAAERVTQAARVFCSTEDYQYIKRMCELEEKYNLRSHFNFYAASQRCGTEVLFDPSYNVEDAELKLAIKELANAGWTIGLHNAFNSWEDAKRISDERERLSKVVGHEITSCRQHWLRFSWLETWKAQEKAGLLLDTTLGFNDRSGFRNGSAQEFVPDGCSKLRAQVMILMDSHLYDYAQISGSARRSAVSKLLREVRFVGGTATVLWHTHVLGNDYGWGAGFEELLKEVACDE